MIERADLAECKRETRCKVCGQVARLFGVADFNKNCEELNGKFLPLTGVPIYYHRCESCGLVFTEALDHWNKNDYLEHIYNDEYVVVDPDYVESRPKDYSGITLELLQERREMTHLDYGGGNGTLSTLVRNAGFDSSSWDPMDAAAQYPDKAFDLLTAFEVIEHTPEPLATLKEMLGFCRPDRPLMLFSTLTLEWIKPLTMGFWYLAPRNGHITVHTPTSLQALFKQVDLQVHHYDNGFHLAFRTRPEAADLQLFARMDHRSALRKYASNLRRKLLGARVSQSA